MIIELGLAFLILSSFPYIVYLLGIQFGKKSTPLTPLTTYPPISLVISAYNEDLNVERRIENIAAQQYPGEMEIVFVDDGSTDNTFSVARYYLDKYKFDYRLIKNPVQLGTSSSYNKAISKTKNEIVVVTDADVLFGKDALQKLITRLRSSSEIGAVTGDLQPIAISDTIAQLELNYRSLYGRMCDWESATDSTFNFNGALMAFEKQAVVRIDDTRGADDANIAFTVIQNGYRAIYEKEAVVYETTPASIIVQYKQKIRRATLLIEAILANGNILKQDRDFSKFFFVRMWMILISPSAFFLGCILFFPILLLIPLIVYSSFAQTFILNQFYLVMGLINLGKDVRTWESTASQEKERIL